MDKLWSAIKERTSGIDSSLIDYATVFSSLYGDKWKIDIVYVYYKDNKAKYVPSSGLPNEEINSELHILY